MPDTYDGAQVTTFFINRLVRMRPMGHCAEFLLACANDHMREAFPDLRLICPRDFALDASAQTIEFLRQTISPPLVPARIHRYMC